MPVNQNSAPREQTILVVEDEPQVRQLTQRILQNHGYRVLTVEHSPDALTLLENDPEIDLLLTDMVMPQLSGLQLAEKARSLRPGLRILYMSGYPRDLWERGEIDPNLPLLEKPFDASTLLGRVADAIAVTAKA
jgi:CheY-like chemotaxis protein